MSEQKPSQRSEPRAIRAGRSAGRAADRGLERLLHIQRPVVLAHIRSIRRGKPDATPAEILRVLERRYLAAVTGGGAATGAVSAIPGIGTVAGLAVSSAEAIGFLEASALFVQSAAEVHGITVEDPERARALVMTLVLGDAGKQVLMQVVGQASGKPTDKTAKVGELVGKALPRSIVERVLPRLTQVFVHRFALSEGASVFGRILPFGIGAVVGGGANFAFGRSVIASVRGAFAEAPPSYPAWLEPIAPERTPRAKRRALER